MDLNELTKNPEQLKQLISVLQQLLPKSDNENSNSEENFQNPIRTKGGKTNFSQSRPNKFENMMEKGMHKDDIEIDKKLSSHPPVARARDFQTIRVKCRVCGKEEEINPSLSSETTRYKCNNCSTSAG